MLKGENTDLIGRTGSYRMLCLINSICFFFLVVRMIRGTLQILGCCLNRRVLQCEEKKNSSDSEESTEEREVAFILC